MSKIKDIICRDNIPTRLPNEHFNFWGDVHNPCEIPIEVRATMVDRGIGVC